MGWFSRSSSDKPSLKRLSKVKRLEKQVACDEYEESDNDDVPTSDYVKEFREGIEEISDMFTNGGDENGGDKFGKLSFGLANLCNYRNTIFDELVGNGMSESNASNKLKSILVEAGFNNMMLEIVSFREANKKRGRKKKVNI